MSEQYHESVFGLRNFKRPFIYLLQLRLQLPINRIAKLRQLPRVLLLLSLLNDNMLHLFELPLLFNDPLLPVLLLAPLRPKLLQDIAKRWRVGVNLRENQLFRFGVDVVMFLMAVMIDFCVDVVEDFDVGEELGLDLAVVGVGVVRGFILAGGGG